VDFSYENPSEDVTQNGLLLCDQDIGLLQEAIEEVKGSVTVGLVYAPKMYLETNGFFVLFEAGERRWLGEASLRSRPGAWVCVLIDYSDNQINWWVTDQERWANVEGLANSSAVIIDFPADPPQPLWDDIDDLLNPSPVPIIDTVDVPPSKEDFVTWFQATQEMPFYARVSAEGLPLGWQSSEGLAEFREWLSLEYYPGYVEQSGGAYPYSCRNNETVSFRQINYEADRDGTPEFGAQLAEAIDAIAGARRSFKAIGYVDYTANSSLIFDHFSSTYSYDKLTQSTAGFGRSRWASNLRTILLGLEE